MFRCHNTGKISITKSANLFVCYEVRIIRKYFIKLNFIQFAKGDKSNPFDHTLRTKRSTVKSLSTAYIKATQPAFKIYKLAYLYVILKNSKWKLQHNLIGQYRIRKKDANTELRINCNNEKQHLRETIKTLNFQYIHSLFSRLGHFLTHYFSVTNHFWGFGQGAWLWWTFAHWLAWNEKNLTWSNHVYGSKVQSRPEINPCNLSYRYTKLNRKKI